MKRGHVRQPEKMHELLADSPFQINTFGREDLLGVLSHGKEAFFGSLGVSVAQFSHSQI